MLKFSQYLTEAYNPQRVISDLERLFVRYGFGDQMIKSDTGPMLPLMDPERHGKSGAKLNKEEEGLLNSIREYGKKNGTVLAATVSLGYSFYPDEKPEYASNNISTMVAADKANPRKLFHITHGANVDNILKNGIEAKQAQEHSDSFSGVRRNVYQLYKAVFAVKKKSDIKQVSRMFTYRDPVIFEIDAKKNTWYTDYLMRSLDSYVTFENIKPENIKQI